MARTRSICRPRSIPAASAPSCTHFVLGYDKDKLKDAPKSWADFCDTKKYPGKRSLRQVPKTTLEFALIADGVAPKDVYKVLATDGASSAPSRSSTPSRPTSSGGRPAPSRRSCWPSGEVVMTSAYNGRIDSREQEREEELQMVWDGALYTIDSWVILKGSPNKDAA